MKALAPDENVMSKGGVFDNNVRVQQTEMKGIPVSNVATYFDSRASAAISVVANSNLRASAKPFVFTRKPTCAEQPETPRKPMLKRYRSQNHRERRAIINRARFYGRHPRTMTLEEV